MGAVSSRRDEEPEVVVLATVGDSQSVMPVLVGPGDAVGVCRNLGLAQDADVRNGDVVAPGGGDGVVAK